MAVITNKSSQHNHLVCLHLQTSDGAQQTLDRTKELGVPFIGSNAMSQPAINHAIVPTDIPAIISRYRQ